MVARAALESFAMTYDVERRDPDILRMLPADQPVLKSTVEGSANTRRSSSRPRGRSAEVIWHRVAPDEPAAHERGDGSCCCLAPAARFTDRIAIVRLGCLDCGCPPRDGTAAPATAP